MKLSFQTAGLPTWPVLLVKTPVDAADRPAIAGKLRAIRELGAKDVFFLTPPQGKGVVRVETVTGAVSGTALLLGGFMQFLPIIIGLVVIVLAVLVIRSMVAGKGDYKIDFSTSEIVVGETATATLNTGSTSSSNGSSEPTVTWTSSENNVVTVEGDGLTATLTAESLGSATITATMAGGVTQTCLVHNSVTSGASSSSGSGSGASGALSLNRTDFTLEAGQAFQVKVSGTSSTPTWSIGNTAVATVSGDGTVKHVGKGQTTLTCTVDGKTLTCIVRCN